MENVTGLPLEAVYSDWRAASAECRDFYKANERNWSPEVDAVYQRLRDRSENLWFYYCSLRTGRSVDKIKASVNESIHSPRD